MFYTALHLVTGHAQHEAGTAARLVFASHRAVVPLGDPS